MCTPLFGIQHKERARECIHPSFSHFHTPVIFFGNLSVCVCSCVCLCVLLHAGAGLHLCGGFLLLVCGTAATVVL